MAITVGGMSTFDFERDVLRTVNLSKGRATRNNASRKTVIDTLITALGSDTTKHDGTIEAPPAALRGDPANTDLLAEEMKDWVNKAKAGGLTVAQITASLTAISTALGTD